MKYYGITGTIAVLHIFDVSVESVHCTITVTIRTATAAVAPLNDGLIVRAIWM